MLGYFHCVSTHLSIKTSISKPQQKRTKDSNIYTVCVCVWREECMSWKLNQSNDKLHNPSPATESISAVEATGMQM